MASEHKQIFSIIQILLYLETMSNSNRNFHSHLVIIDHFDDIINKIDIKTETLLEEDEKFNKKSKLESGAVDDRRNKLNELREKQIEKIKEIKEINLNLLNNATEIEEEETSLDLEQIKEKLIHFDCVLLEEPNILYGFDLWITSWFYNQKNLNFLK